MEKKQRPPKRKFKEIYTEHKERIHNKEKLPKERKKRIIAGTFAVLYIIISLFMLLGKCNFVNASSESTQSSLGYATVPYNALIFNTNNDPKYKQYDYPNTNIRESDTFYNSLNTPTGVTVEEIVFWECIYQSSGLTTSQIADIKALPTYESHKTYEAYVGDGNRAIFNTSDPETLPDFEIFSGFAVETYDNDDGTIEMYLYGYGRDTYTLWDSTNGWLVDNPRSFYIPEVTNEEIQSELNGEGWDYIKIISSFDTWKTEQTISEGSYSDLTWKLGAINTQTTGALNTVHELILGEPNFLMNTNALRLNIKGGDFVISDSIMDRSMTPKLWIEHSTNPNMKISIAVTITYEYVLKTALDNGTTDIQVKMGISIFTYQYNSSENTAYNQMVEMFPDFRKDITLDPVFNNNPQYYVITDTECNIQITGIDSNTIPKITILNWYGWSNGNGTRATMDNFLTYEIGNIRTGETIPILPDDGFLTWLGTALDGFFNHDIVGVFSLGDVLWIAIGIGALFAVLKYFAGG